MEWHEAEIRGVRMRWLEEGVGTPVVLLHGIPTSPLLWRHVAPRLEGVRVLAWELVGYAGSIAAGKGRDISVRAQSEYLHAWLGHLDLERSILVGHDLGGGIAQIAAVRWPERVAGLVLINAIAYDSWPIPSVRWMRRSLPLLPLLPNAVLRPVYGRLLRAKHDDRQRAKESVRVHWPFYADVHAGSALARQVRSLHTRDTLEFAGGLPSLRLPARVVWGTAGVQDFDRYARRLGEDLRCPVIPIEGAPHFVPEDHPEIVANAIHEVVGAVASAADPRHGPTSPPDAPGPR